MFALYSLEPLNMEKSKKLDMVCTKNFLKGLFENFLTANEQNHLAMGSNYKLSSPSKFSVIVVIIKVKKVQKL